MSVVRAFHTGWVIGESNGASARSLLQPLCTRDVSESSVCDVPFGLSFVFPHHSGDNTARTKILDRTPYRNC